VWFVLLLGCAPGLRFPGPLDHLGRGADEPLAAYLARQTHPAPASRPSPARARPAGPEAARKVAAAAETFLGDRRIVVAGETFRYDCSGLVEAAHAAASCPQAGSSAMLHDLARDRGVLHHRKLPTPGDVAFFSNTYDRDDNGRLDDDLTHSAVVTDVDADGTIEMVHVGSQGVVRLRMNLRRPHDPVDPAGARVNDPLRNQKRGDPPGTRYLAGELWVGFGSLWAIPP
jgi:hypothetical protein